VNNHFRPSLVLVGLVMMAGTAFAQKPAVVITPIDVGSVQTLQIGSPISANSVCRIGPMRSSPTSYAVDYILPPDDGYYTLLRLSDCSECPSPPVVMITNAHFVLEWRQTCPINVRVGIVGADYTNPACPKPDPATVLFPLTPFVINPPGPGSADISIALPQPVCVSGDSYLAIIFDNFNQCTIASPRLITNVACVPCVSWNLFQVGHEDELCAKGFPGNPVHYVEADCCVNTSTEFRSWGRIKLLYR
jgi:hypothetical protein